MSSVTQVHRAVGSWEITFTGIPQDVVDQLEELGHIAVTEAREGGPAIADSLLDSARYVGVVRTRRKEAVEFDFTLKGAGLAWWLGTEDDLGAVYEAAVPFSNASLSTVITGLLPDSIQPGTLTNTGIAPYTFTHRWQTPRQAIDYYCDTVGATWRVNNNGTLDAGPQSAVFASGRALIVRREQDAGEDMTIRAFPGPADTERDREGFTTRAVVLGRIEEFDVVEGSADLNPALNPFLDLFGNPVVMTRLVSETMTDGPTASVRAQIIVDQYAQPQRVVNLNTDDYDMRGVIEVGDMVEVYDPEAGLVDLSRERQFRGQRLNPVLEQVTSMTWPVTAGMGVYYRSRTGVWIDLSDWVVPSSSTTSIEVGSQDRALIDSGSTPVGRIPEPDTSIPNTPTFTTPFTQSQYLTASGVSRSQVQVQWVAPLTNTDGTAFTDGSHFEIRFRATAASTTDWDVRFAAMDQTTLLLQDLEPGTEYEFQIRALDASSPPNASAWSASHVMTTNLDVIPPPTPAAPTVAGSRIAVQVKHELGVSTGGTFNLPLDLDHLEVHVGTSSGFTPDDTTRVGKITATWGLIAGQIPVVETFAVDATVQVFVKVIAVDTGGNKSDPSAAAGVTAQLIDSAHISDLTATKITAGTLSATIALSGLFRTASSGARAEVGVNGSLSGFRLYRTTGTLALSGAAATGDLTLYKTDGTTPTLRFTAADGNIFMTGELRTAETGVRWVINPANSAVEQIRGYPQTGTNYSSLTIDSTTTDRSFVRLESSTGASGEAGKLTISHTNAMIRWGGPGDSDYNLVDTSSAGVLLRAGRSGGRITMEVLAPGTVNRDGGYADLGAGVAATRFGKQSPTNNTNIAFFNSGAVTVTTANNQEFSTAARFRASLGFISGGAAEMVELGGTRIFMDWNANGLQFRTVTGGGVVKTFVIDHPSPAKADRYLVHGTTESPHAGVEYWGTAHVEDGTAEVQLPDYFEDLTADANRVVVLTVVEPDEQRTRPERRRPRPAGPARIYRSGDGAVVELEDRPADGVPGVSATYPRNGRFRIRAFGTYPETFEVHWLVKAVRADTPALEVEPRRDAVTLRGNGPYTYAERAPQPGGPRA